MDSYLNKCPLTFKIDTGADVTALPDSVYDRTCDGPLQTANRVLRGPSKQTLNVRGFITAKLSRDQTEIEDKIYIVKGLHTSSWSSSDTSAEASFLNRSSSNQF